VRSCGQLSRAARLRPIAPPRVSRSGSRTRGRRLPEPSGPAARPQPTDRASSGAGALRPEPGQPSAGRQAAVSAAPDPHLVAAAAAASRRPDGEVSCARSMAVRRTRVAGHVAHRAKPRRSSTPRRGDLARDRTGSGGRPAFWRRPAVVPAAVQPGHVVLAALRAMPTRARRRSSDSPYGFVRLPQQPLPSRSDEGRGRPLPAPEVSERSGGYASVPERLSVKLSLR
jgi:hypothetical protein